jgi:hypothetical protein
MRAHMFKYGLAMFEEQKLQHRAESIGECTRLGEGAANLELELG